jgi:hypothetical protein
MDPWHAASGTGLLLVAGLTFFAVLAYLRYRAPRVVACPADGSPAAVRADARHAALTLLPRADLRIRDCSRWPARRQCGQMCLDQVESDPLRSPVERFLARWYAERPCARCGAAFRDVQWVRRPPALMDERGRLARWYEHPERLTGVPDRYLPVCWSCHRAATAARAAVEAGAPAPPTAPRSREA